MFKGNIEQLTINNTYYRKVLNTTPNQQLVLMALKKTEDIPKEKHHGTQFIRVEEGTGYAIIGGHKYKLSDGIVVVIPPHTWHYIKATSNLKLYTIYSPPEHEHELIQKRQKSKDKVIKKSKQRSKRTSKRTSKRRSKQRSNTKRKKRNSKRR